MHSQSESATEHLGKPTNNEYAVNAGINLLDAFVVISRQIPIPGVPEAVAIAVTIIKACEVRTSVEVSTPEFIIALGKQRNVGRGKALKNSDSKSDNHSDGKA
jgi:hypothetical protein